MYSWDVAAPPYRLCAVLFIIFCSFAFWLFPVLGCEGGNVLLFRLEPRKSPADCDQQHQLLCAKTRIISNNTIVSIQISNKTGF